VVAKATGDHAERDDRPADTTQPLLGVLVARRRLRVKLLGLNRENVTHTSVIRFDESRLAVNLSRGDHSSSALGANAFSRRPSVSHAVENKSHPPSVPAPFASVSTTDARSFRFSIFLASFSRADPSVSSLHPSASVVIKQNELGDVGTRHSFHFISLHSLRVLSSSFASDAPADDGSVRDVRDGNGVHVRSFLSLLLCACSVRARD